jgi:hypothetical protein
MRNTKDILDELDTIDAESSQYDQIRNAEEIRFVLLPPIEVDISDEDDARRDSEDDPTIHDLGKGVLANLSELEVVNKDGVV